MTDTYYKKWWEKNSEKVLAERRERYRTDPEFRAAINEGNRAYRQRTRRKKNADRARPAQYVHDLRGAADALDVTVSSLRWWIQQEFMPRPFHHGGKFWFTEGQVTQLEQLTTFLIKYPKTGRKSPEFTVVLDLIQFNWDS